MRPTIIYALCDPTTNEVRYIGKTNNPTTRYNAHKYTRSKRYNANWVRSLRPLRPLMLELERVDDGWVEAEQFWVAYMKSLGARLTNLTLGGEGCIGHKLSEESILQMSMKLKGNRSGCGHKHNVEHLINISTGLLKRYSPNQDVGVKKTGNKYIVRIQTLGNRVTLGKYDSIEEARDARNNEVKRILDGRI